MSYERNYGGADEPGIVEMVAVGPHSVVRRDVAERLGLRILADPDD